MKLEKKTIQGFPVERLENHMAEALEHMAREGRVQAVTMTTLADSGHPAGSLSSMEMYLLTYGVAELSENNADTLDRDHVVISHGHTSPGAYAALAAWGLVDGDEAVAFFRACGSPFQGHVEREIPGIDWGSGNLGQGLAAGVGYALAQRARGFDRHVYVLMGDGGQVKGQHAEARRVAKKQKLSNITALIDWNHIQISGRIEEIMPAGLKDLWEADGWRVVECDGHDSRALYAALRDAKNDNEPTVLFCRTVMGKGVSFMENRPDYHGKAATGDLYVKAITELGGDPTLLDRARQRRNEGTLPKGRHITPDPIILDKGNRIVVSADASADCRGAFGKALADVGKRNYDIPGKTPVLVFDCDLASSVKTDAFAKECPDWFIQTGIQEHATATISGAASVGGVVGVWADFGVFGLAEAYNQQRLNDINKTNAKVVLTHVGLDVGEDGMTHQSIDYVGLLRNTFGWQLVVPADANQTDAATRWMLSTWGNVCLAMGRSKLPTITREDGSPFYDEGYDFTYGRSDVLREGDDATIVCMGHMTWRALAAHKTLLDKGVRAKVVNVASPLALCEKALRDMASTGTVVTYEDHHAESGLGSLVAARLLELGLSARFARLGVTRFGDSGTADKVMEAMGLSPAHLANKVLELLGKKA